MVAPIDGAEAAPSDPDSTADDGDAPAPAESTAVVAVHRVKHTLLRGPAFDATTAAFLGAVVGRRVVAVAGRPMRRAAARLADEAAPAAAVPDSITLTLLQA
jgi:hypothetical protein